MKPTYHAPIGSAIQQHLVAAGEYGAMPQAARNWAETGALLCEVLGAELEQCRHSSPRTAPGSAAAPPQSSAELQHVPSLQQPACSQGPSSEVSEAQGVAAPLDPGHCPALPEARVGRGDDRAVGIMSSSAQAHLADGPDMSPGNVASSGNADKPQAHVNWPEIVPADQTAQSTGRACMPGTPEPPAEFAAVLCATWHALAPAPIHSDSAPACTQAAAQKQRSSMPSSLQAQQSSGDAHSDDQGAPLTKRAKTAPPAEDTEADPRSDLSREQAAAGTGREGYAAGDQRSLDPPGLGLGFRLLGEPAGFLSCSAQPSSRPALRAALVSELGPSGPSLLIKGL